MKKTKLKAPKKPKAPYFPWKPEKPEKFWVNDKTVEIGPICSYDPEKHFKIGDLKKIISDLDDDEKYIIQQNWRGGQTLKVFRSERVENENYEQQMSDYAQSVLEYDLKYEDFLLKVKKYEKLFEKYIEELTDYHKKLLEDEIVSIKKGEY